MEIRILDFFVVLSLSPIGVFGGIGNLNRSTQDDAGPVGGEDRMKVPQEIKEMDEEHDQHIQDI